jgi:predicted nucleotidyltransferase
LTILILSLAVESRYREIIDAVVDILTKRLSPSRVFLFGSRAKGGNGKHADFDFAVDSSRPSISDQRIIREEIEKIAGLYNVDIVYLESVDKEFKEIILKTGKLIYEK